MYASIHPNVMIAKKKCTKGLSVSDTDATPLRPTAPKTLSHARESGLAFFMQRPTPTNPVDTRGRKNLERYEPGGVSHVSLMDGRIRVPCSKK
jgi:hypothetical protein